MTDYVKIVIDEVKVELVNSWIVRVDGRSLIIPKSNSEVDGNIATIPLWLAEEEEVESYIVD